MSKTKRISVKTRDFNYFVNSVKFKSDDCKFRKGRSLAINQWIERVIPGYELTSEEEANLQGARDEFLKILKLSIKTGDPSEHGYKKMQSFLSNALSPRVIFDKDTHSWKFYDEINVIEENPLTPVEELIDSFRKMLADAIMDNSKGPNSYVCVCEECNRPFLAHRSFTRFCGINCTNNSHKKEKERGTLTESAMFKKMLDMGLVDNKKQFDAIFKDEK